MLPQRRSLLMIFEITFLSHVLAGSDYELDNIFNGDTGIEADSPQKNQCRGVKPDIMGCHSCWPCDAKDFSSYPDVTELSITDSQCSESKFCCINQKSLITRTNDRCGTTNPEGVPRSVRDSLRAVLPGEYPWRAWVYSSQSPKPLCAATYLKEEALAFITTASCVRNRQPGELQVRFEKDGASSPVHYTVIHPDSKSDLALVVVHSLRTAPTWILPCCAPVRPPHYGTTCIAVSEDDKFVYTAMPQASVCADKAAVVGPEVFCAVSPAGDYRPAPGSALACLDHDAETAIYVVYGIALVTSEAGYTTYTNVTHYMPWLRSYVADL